MGLGPVVWAVELPGVLVERWQGSVHFPGRAVPGHRRPALVVDAAVAEHLEVLDLVCLGSLAVAQGGQHADTLQRRLLDTVH